ncbi:hypothetical protein SAMN05216474_3086 [Lishizhenia tianjinensis]|uniref:Lipocalin-like domain-containing protein n=1 Tax=Lishizhenia tianjinensis TaxID=477690 RepID=A0A1I7BU78_9FLAO|nr:hypothetical protein [Lishizhenia tianjinensis]SFT90747.1 hypothetical protein SAMN05216474_3086 [Lishizhenia tianjinensis]
MFNPKFIAFLFVLVFRLAIPNVSFSQTKNKALPEFSASTLLLGDWQLVGIENNYKACYLTNRVQAVKGENELSLSFSNENVTKLKADKKSVFTYEIVEDSLSRTLILKEGEANFRYTIVEVNHFSLIISSELSVSTGLDQTTETVYYTYLRKENEEANLQNILGVWSICSDSVVQDFTLASNTIFTFYKNTNLGCDGVSKLDLEINNSNFQLLQNVSLEHEKSYKFISSNLIVNLDKNLIYFQMNKGLVFDIITLTNDVLEIRLNEELSKRIQ